MDRRGAEAASVQSSREKQKVRLIKRLSRCPLPSGPRHRLIRPLVKWRSGQLTCCDLWAVHSTAQQVGQGARSFPWAASAVNCFLLPVGLAREWHRCI